MHPSLLFSSFPHLGAVGGPAVLSLPINDPHRGMHTLHCPSLIWQWYTGMSLMMLHRLHPPHKEDYICTIWHTVGM